MRRELALSWGNAFNAMHAVGDSTLAIRLARALLASSIEWCGSFCFFLEHFLEQYKGAGAHLVHALVRITRDEKFTQVRAEINAEIDVGW